MKTSNQPERHAPQTRRRVPAPMARAVLACGFFMLMAACGGGGAGGSGQGPQTAPQPPGGVGSDSPPTGSGTVAVTVLDPLGDPFSGATVTVLNGFTSWRRTATADAHGRVTLTGVDVSGDAILVRASGVATFPSDSSFEWVTVPPDGTVNVVVKAEPRGGGAGISSTRMVTGSLGTDGRSFDFEADVILDDYLDNAFYGGEDSVFVEACLPDAGNDSPLFHADCVSGQDGFDAAYSGSASDASAPAQGTSVGVIAAPGRRQSTLPAHSAALLIDQSASNLVSDPSNLRLYGFKHFLAHGTGAGEVSLAAFSNSDVASGRFSLLPRQPVTFYPETAPGFTDDGRSFFATVDSMQARVGGSAPLYGALDRTLDLVAAASSKEVKAVVVVTSGRDDTCGAPANCRAARDAVIRKSRDLAVPIIAVGYSNDRSALDIETLTLLAQGAGGGAMFSTWVPAQLAESLGVARDHLSGLRNIVRAKFHLQSPVAGAFAPGGVVRGTVALRGCDWDICDTVIRVPFAVRIE